MIFSIILIIGILGVSFYAINYFLDLKKCTEYGLFIQDFEKKVDEGYNSDSVKLTFTGNLPSEIKKVCFGSFTSFSTLSEYQDIKRVYGSTNGNMFFYPIAKAVNICGRAAYSNIEHLSAEKLGGFTCFEVNSGKVILKLDKGSFDDQVYIVK